MSEVPTFGTFLPEEIYKHRHVVGAIILNERGCVAVMQVGDRCFLPGGGIEGGETEIETLAREVREECARGVVVGVRLGQAVYYQYAPAYGAWAIHSTYYRADFGPPLDVLPEPDHTLMFVTPEEAGRLLFRRSDAWAVKCAATPGATFQNP